MKKNKKLIIVLAIVLVLGLATSLFLIKKNKDEKRAEALTQIKKLQTVWGEKNIEHMSWAWLESIEEKTKDKTHASYGLEMDQAIYNDIAWLYKTKYNVTL